MLDKDVFFPTHCLNGIKGPSDLEKLEMNCWKENEDFVCENKHGNNNFIMKKTIEV